MTNQNRGWNQGEGRNERTRNPDYRGNSGHGGMRGEDPDARYWGRGDDDRGGRYDAGDNRNTRRGDAGPGVSRDNETWNDEGGAGMSDVRESYSTRSRDSFNDDYQRAGEGGRWGHQQGNAYGERQGARDYDQYGQGRRYDQEQYRQGGQGPYGRSQEGQYNPTRYGQGDRYAQQIGQSGQRGDHGQGVSQYGQRGGDYQTREQGMRQGFAGKGPKGYQRSDERVREQISDVFTDDDSLDASDIEIKVEAGEVTLTGTVPSRQCKRTAEDLAERCSGVKEVSNQLRVKQHDDRKASAVSDKAHASKAGNRTDPASGAATAPGNGTTRAS